MRKVSNTNRLLSLVLCLCMVLAMMPGIPLVAQAAGTEGMIIIEMSDSYGDGWSGNAIEIYADGKLVDTATLADDLYSGTWTGKLDPHNTYTFKWVVGDYAHETSFVIYVGTTESKSASGSSYATGDTIHTTSPLCPTRNYVDGVCTACGAACIHDLDNNGRCGICGYACPNHSFADGVCATCGGVCTHSVVYDGICRACKASVNLTIDMTAKYSYGWQNCASITVFADRTEIGVAKLVDEKFGSWSVPYSSMNTYTFQWAPETWPWECAFTIKLGDTILYTADKDACDSLESGVFFTIDPGCSNHTSFDENFLCKECGLPCPHKAWTDSVCDACGFVCGTDAAHDWDLGTCKVCSAACNHSFTDYVCDTCGLNCGVDADHSFGEDQECDVCGFACGTDAAHDWNLGTCKVCSLTCTHSFTDYVCDTCGLNCGVDANHSFGEDQECDVCGFVCGTDAEHAWNKGTCTVCGIVCPHEHYELGLCTVCGYYESAVQNGVGANGFALYEIYNASQLLWFADYVNSGEILKTITIYDYFDTFDTYYTTGCVNAKLMADIDMTGLPWIPIGIRDIEGQGYTGVFDGNGHTVSGIDYTLTTEYEPDAGFFGLFHGTVKNLTVRGSFKAVSTGQSSNVYVGGIVAYSRSANYTVDYDYSTYEYVHESVYPVIENCAFIGTVSAEANHQILVGGIVGYFQEGTMTNCLSAATVTFKECTYINAGALTGADRDSTYTNCYYDSTLCPMDASAEGALEGVTGLATADFADGSVAYKLGFGQTLGTDTYPTYGDDPVYPVTTGCVTYSNTQTVPTEKAHVGTPTCTQAALCQDCGEYFGEALGHGEYDADGKCTVCGEYDVPKQNGVGANGFALYEIENASQLLWFINYVNSGEILKTLNTSHHMGVSYTYYTTGCVNAKLMADIDMTGLPWSPIGRLDLQDRGYVGVFDGNGHTVSGIDYTVTSEDSAYAGFFGRFHGTVKNLTVRGSFKAVTTGEKKTAYAGGIAAFCNYSAYRLAMDNYEYVYPVIENCAFIGTVSGEANHMVLAGGIVGFFQRGTMTNCLSAATVISNECSYPYTGGLVGSDNASSYTNCYYDSTVYPMDACTDGPLEGVTGLATADFADGAIAYTLGFGQTLGTDTYPTYGDDKVFQVLNCKEDTVYSNTDANIDHTWITIDCETPITCSTCGATDGDAIGHNWMDATCVAPKTCSACGATEGYPDYDNHSSETTAEFDWSDPYDGKCYVEANLLCDLCGQSISSSYGYGILTGSVEATDCMNPGSETYEITLELDGTKHTDVHTFVILSENHIGEYVNGFCSACGGYEAAVWNEDEGVYEIGNAGQLYWYAQYLNEYNPEIYAKLVADIVIPDNAPNWEPINASYAYFDGNYHTISGLKCIGGDRTYVGLFGREGWWYEISNLHITDSYFEGKEYVGAVVACMSNGGSVTNCAVTNTTVKGDYDYVGGLVGCLSSSHANNCFSTATVIGAEGKVLIGYHSVGYGGIENCYFLGTEDDYDGTTAMTAADFASGKIAYLLQSGIPGKDVWDEETGEWIGTAEPELVWGQTIGEDDYPVLKGAKVYEVTNCKGEIAYRNTAENGAHTEQTVPGYDATCTEPGLTDGVKCSVCGETIKAQEPISVLGHSYDNDCDADCNRCGEDRQITGHEYAYQCSTNCSKCGELTRPEAEHIRTGPVCIEGHCVYGCGLKMPAIADHSYEAYYELPPTCINDGAYYYQCETCGDTYAVYPPASGNHVDADNSGRCDTCSCLMQPAKLCSTSISMNGNIAINYYMLLSDEVLADGTAYMQFTLVDGEVIQVPVSLGVATVVNGETYHVFTCEVNAKEMADDVISQFFYEGGSTKAHTYNVRTYAHRILANTTSSQAMKELAQAMLNYGAASQLHFAYNTDDLANNALASPDYSEVVIEGFDAVSGQGTESAKLYSASLILKSETTLRFFFTGKITASRGGQELEVKERGGLYYVDVVGIAAKDLDENITVTISDGTKTVDVFFNPMSYCQGVLNDTTGAFDQQMKDLVAALYLYNQAANKYFAR